MTTNMKSKKALVSSVIALVLCMAMLIGTTFAWFTDSVTSGKNQIVAGNLDIELEYLVDGSWKKVDETTNVFEENTLWEPGHTEVVYLRVINKGTLALKYQLGINVAKEISSINVAGEELVLSNYIQFGVIEGENTYATREDAIAALTGSKALSEGYGIAGEMEANAPAEYLTLVVYMPESVGNKANYKTGEVAPKIELGINLMATQKVSENDSFGNDYDENAAFSAIPGAPFRKLGVNPTVALMNNNEEVTLDTSYEFKATQTPAEAEKMDIALYNADFVISFDKDIAANSVALGGQYDAWSADWVAFAIESDIAAGQQIRLLESYAKVTYAELCEKVKNFKCGVADLAGTNGGTTMTVELRLYKTYIDDTNSLVETGESIVAGSYSYTFAYENKIQVTPTKETITCYDLFGNSGNENLVLDFDAYTFQADNFQAQYPLATYGDWTADYFVSTDAPIAEGMILVGNYPGFGWLGFKVPVSTTAYEPTGLLTTFQGGNNAWTYAEICENVGTFLCGADDISGNNAGVNVTVTLRLTSPNGAQTIDVVTITETL